MCYTRIDQKKKRGENSCGWEKDGRCDVLPDNKIKKKKTKPKGG